MLNSLINMVAGGAMNNNPMMGQFNKLMGGKNPQQQMQTLINLAQNKGIDINKKMFTKEDLAKFGVKLP